MDGVSWFCLRCELEMKFEARLGAIGPITCGLRLGELDSASIGKGKDFLECIVHA